MEEIVAKKKLSCNIERTNVRGFICEYNYKFSTTQWLENIDNLEFFGVSHNDMKEKVIENLVSEFKMSLNTVIFGDPTGREYVEYFENLKPIVDSCFYHPENEGVAKTFRDISTNKWYYEDELIKLLGYDTVISIKHRFDK